MHARAACRLESLGFERVYRYAPGKADWRAAGMRMESTVQSPLHAIDALRHDVGVCLLDASIATARREGARAYTDFCIVLGDDAIVLGRVRLNELSSVSDRSPVSEVMESGPATIRADEDLAAVIERMQPRKVATIVVSDPDGRFIGILYREDGERLLAAGGTTP
jgi:predicted transcriptional regulator